HRTHLLEELGVHVRTLLGRTRHSPSLPAALAAAADDVLVRAAVLTCAIAQRRLAPGGLRAGHADRRLALTTAVRVVDRVHHRAAHLRPAATVPVAAGLAELDLAVLRVADDPDGRATGLEHLAHLAGGHAQQRVA